MTAPALRRLLAHLDPRREPGCYVFACAPRTRDVPAGAIAAVREAGTWSLVLPEADAAALGLVPLFRAAWITLTVASELEAVGLTAAVAGALAGRGIACNVVAGAAHDHLFVPFDRGADAMDCLLRLQYSAAAEA